MVHIVLLGFQLSVGGRAGGREGEREGWREVTSVHSERHSVSLREAPGHSAKQAPAGKMRTHLGFDPGVCVWICGHCCRRSSPLTAAPYFLLDFTQSMSIMKS